MLVIEQRGPTCVYCGRRPCHCVKTVVKSKPASDPDFLAKLAALPAECDCHFLAMGFGEHRADCTWVQQQKSKREVLPTTDPRMKKAASIVNKAINAALEKEM